MTSETKFKETEIGMIPEDWELLTVDDIKSKEKKSVISGPFGSNISKKYFVESGIPVIRGNNLTTDMKRFVEEGFVFVTPEKADELNTWALRNDIVFTAAGTLGQVGIIENNSKFEKYIISNKQLRLRVNEKKVCPLYAFYWFSSPEMTKRIVNYNTGSTIPLINLSVLKKLPIVVPSLKIQDSIVYILDSLDQKIELNYQMSKTLEQIAQTLFKHWFIDFEFPDENGNPYKSSGGRMVDSELGGIPEGWKVKSFSEVIDVNPTRRLSKGKLATKVSMADLNTWQSWIDSWQEEEYKSGPKFKNGDTLFARITPSLENGKTAFVSFLNEGETAFGSTEFIVFGPKAIVSGTYIYCLSRSEYVRETAINSMTGTSGRQRVPNDCFDQLLICVPAGEIVKKFDSIITPLFEKIESNSKEYINLGKIRDSLLPKLMSGKIRVEC
ncbi:Type I restriction-modification system, specificity subunit S [Methanosarcina sp. Kolksee]|uniref:restriction endonuclease subunit S n=1 Tax=Methanosarcina sp. Kolksee TaxID=1434099 RepID=UPI000616064B|nr:restriction endonuclease subunit S [Methanosarcina sp. Kolksee]AKB48568.1 Type I restriction-modification system, specificity subunit S [Methanosarcina sp. Kolksee]